MSEYNELVKSLDRIRDFARDFFIYGFRTRKSFSGCSGRTYDNERRRIENLLSDFVHYDHDKTGKRVSLSTRADRVSENPFFRLYLCKSFTDNDIMLHFYLMELLSGDPVSASEAADLLSMRYGAVFDTQIVRAKLKEYKKAGIFACRARGKSLSYSLSKFGVEALLRYKNIGDMLAFFSESAPLGTFGYFLTQRIKTGGNYFLFRHHFIAPVLDDVILLPLLAAMRESRVVRLKNFRHGKIGEFSGVPLKFLIGSSTGRRYVALRDEKRFRVLRIDRIKKVLPGEIQRIPENIRERLNRISTWGTAEYGRAKLESVRMMLYIDEQNESYVLKRLMRESRGGEITREGENIFLFKISVASAREILPWARSFIGRAMEFSCSNEDVARRFYDDMKKMAELYPSEENGNGNFF